MVKLLHTCLRCGHVILFIYITHTYKHSLLYYPLQPSDVSLHRNELSFPLFLFPHNKHDRCSAFPACIHAAGLWSSFYCDVLLSIPLLWGLTCFCSTGIRLSTYGFRPDQYTSCTCRVKVIRVGFFLQFHHRLF